MTDCKNCGNIVLTRILEAGVPVLCPTCGPLYSIAKNVSNSSNFSKETKEIATVVCGVLLIAVGAVYLDKLLSSLK